VCVCCDGCAEVDKHGVESNKASLEAIPGQGKSDDRSRHVVCVIAVLSINVNYKMWQLRMHCKLRQPDATQSLTALISSPVSSLNSLCLSVAVLELFLLLTCCYAVTLNFDPVTLTFDLVHV